MYLRVLTLDLKRMLYSRLLHGVCMPTQSLSSSLIPAFSRPLQHSNNTHSFTMLSGPSVPATPRASVVAVPTCPIRHSEYYFEDGNLVILVSENVKPVSVATN